MDIEKKIQELVEAKFEEEGFEDCFLVEIKHNTANNKLEVFLDADESLTFGKCQKVSRYLEGFIDENGWLGEKYVLEVSSPGISKPLKLKRQYIKNIGRSLKVTFKKHGSKLGTLKAVTDDHVVLEEEVIIRDKKKKIKELQEVIIPYEDISKAVVQIVFN